MQVIPVAGFDSMLMTLSGCHAPCFTRNLVILKDSAGHTGIGEIHGGTARNIMAGSAYLTGTLRTWHTDVRERMIDRIERVAGKTSHAFGADITFSFEEGNPSVVNDPACAEAARRAVVEVLGEEAIGSYEGTLAGEDFAEYLQHVPGVFVFVGTHNPAIGADHPQHSCYYTVDESMLAKGAMVAAQWTCDMLA